MYLWYRCFRESAHKNSRPGLYMHTIVFFQDYTPHFNTCFLTAEEVTNSSTSQLSDILKVFDQISLECQDIREVFDQSQLSLLKTDTGIEKIIIISRCFVHVHVTKGMLMAHSKLAKHRQSFSFPCFYSCI